MKRFISILMAVCLILACTPAVFANDFSDVSFSGLGDKMNENAKLYGETLKTCFDYLSGNLTDGEFKEINEEIRERLNFEVPEDEDDFYFKFMQSLREDDISTRDVIVDFVNGVRGEVVKSGGNAGRFNFNYTQFTRSDGLYVVFDKCEIYGAHGTQYNSNVAYCYRIIGTLYDENGVMLEQKPFNAYGWGVVRPDEEPICGVKKYFKDFKVADNGNVSVLATTVDKEITHVSWIYDQTFYCEWLDEENIVPTDSTESVENLSDDDLMKVIEDMINALGDAFPDTETSEGLLQSILNELKKIAEKINGNGGTDLTGVLFKLDQIIALLEANNGLLSSMLEGKDDGVDYTIDDVRKLVEDKFKYDIIKKNINMISHTFFGIYAFSENNESGEMLVTVSSDMGTTTSLFAPDVPVTFHVGNSVYTYNLFSSISAFDNRSLMTVKKFIGLFLEVVFFITLFRSIPDIVGNASRLRASGYINGGD